MLTRIHITCLLILIVAIWTTVLFVMGVPLTWDYVKPFAITVSGVSVACVVFDRWLWRSRLFKGWLVKRPDLQGTWRAVMQSSYTDPQTQKPIPPIECVAVIRQSFSAFSLRMFTKESSSFLTAHKLIPQNDGVFQLAGVYQNTPDVHLRGIRSEIHYGALLLEVRGDPAVELNGHYWTDRLTKGSLVLFDRRTTLLNGYEEAAKIYRP